MPQLKKHIHYLCGTQYYVRLPSFLRQWAPRFIVADIIFFTVMILLTYGIAFISYNAYEKHFLKLKRFFGKATVQESTKSAGQDAVSAQKPYFEGVETAKDKPAASSS
jgi:peptidoglycan/LPS O-acetylase OafA/YrhL